MKRAICVYALIMSTSTLAGCGDADWPPDPDAPVVAEESASLAVATDRIWGDPHIDLEGASRLPPRGELIFDRCRMAQRRVDRTADAVCEDCDLAAGVSVHDFIGNDASLEPGGGLDLPSWACVDARSALTDMVQSCIDVCDVPADCNPGGC